MIRKVERTVTETGTTINQDVELSQKGHIQTVVLSGKIFAIPTTIPNPTNLSLLALNSDAAIALGASGGIAGVYSDLVLHFATGASLSFASIASDVDDADIGLRIRMTNAYKLFVAKGTGGTASAASDSLIVEGDFWRELTEFGTNQKKYLLVNIANSASAGLKTVKCNFAYEVRGYGS